MHSKVIIIGSGPAGYTAAIYAARAKLSPLVFEGFLQGIAGGQLMTTTTIENFPGFPEGIWGAELMANMKKQAQTCGAEVLSKDVDRVDFSQRPFKLYSGDFLYTCDACIIATGASAKKLEIPGSEEFWQKGVTACAVCDGAAPIFKEKNLFVIGGGDSAVEEALFLTRYGSKVYLVHRRGELRASKAMQERLFSNSKIEVLWNSQITGIFGDSVVRSVKITNTYGQETNMDAGGVFFAIGHQPNTKFLQGALLLDESGYIITKPGTTQTNIKGVFAAGDVQDKVYRQAITAAGSGCMAALEAERFLG